MVMIGYACRPLPDALGKVKATQAENLHTIT
jgi:hypothetical protein